MDHPNDCECNTCWEAGNGHEGPTCSLCDAPGHGYPGGGPCPLEERGAYEPPEPYWGGLY